MKVYPDLWNRKQLQVAVMGEEFNFRKMLYSVVFWSLVEESAIKLKRKMFIFTLKSEIITSIQSFIPATTYFTLWSRTCQIWHIASFYFSRIFI